MNINNFVINGLSKAALISLVLFTCLGASEDSFSQTITWQHVYDTPVSDYGLDGVSSYDGGYVVLYKLAEQFGGTRLLTLDAFGKQVSSSIVDSTSIGTCIIQTKDSGYIISGYNSAGRLIKLDKFFNVIWARSYFINNQQAILRKVIELPDGDFLACGDASVFPLNAYVLRTDSSGILMWQFQYSLSSSFTIAYDICFSMDSYIYFTGVVSENGVAKTLVCKLDESGKTIWKTKYGTTGKGDGQAGLGIRPEVPEYLYLCGTSTLRYSYDGHFTKIDSSGNIIYQKLYDTADEYRSFVERSNGFFLCGNNGDLGRISLLQVNKNGIVVSNRFYGFGGVDDFNYMSSFRIVEDIGMLITGETTFPTGGDENLNIAVLKTDSSGNITSINQSSNFGLVRNFDLYQNHPNPFNPKTTIPFITHSSGNAKLTVFDIRGQIIDVLFDKFVNPGHHKVEFNAQSLSSGIYFYRLNFEGNSRTKKFVLIK